MDNALVATAGFIPVVVPERTRLVAQAHPPEGAMTDRATAADAAAFLFYFDGAAPPNPDADPAVIDMSDPDSALYVSLKNAGPRHLHVIRVEDNPDPAEAIGIGLRSYICLSDYPTLPMSVFDPILLEFDLSLVEIILIVEHGKPPALDFANDVPFRQPDIRYSVKPTSEMTVLL